MVLGKMRKLGLLSRQRKVSDIYMDKLHRLQKLDLTDFAI